MPTPPNAMQPDNESPEARPQISFQEILAALGQIKAPPQVRTPAPRTGGQFRPTQLAGLLEMRSRGSQQRPLSLLELLMG